MYDFFRIDQSIGQQKLQYCSTTYHKEKCLEVDEESPRKLSGYYRNARISFYQIRTKHIQQNFRTFFQMLLFVSKDPFTRSVFKDPILLVPKIGSCERIENDLPTHGSVILKKRMEIDSCSISIRHSSWKMKGADKFCMISLWSINQLVNKNFSTALLHTIKKNVWKWMKNRPGNCQDIIGMPE